LLEGFAQDSLIKNKNRRHKTGEIIARTLIFSKNVSTGSTTAKNYKPKYLQEKKRTKSRNKIYPNFCQRNQADLGNLQKHVSAGSTTDHE
jgi:hypothetical protein